MTTIDVTVADIEAGERHECHVCPVALAVKRVLRRGLIPSVTGGYITLFESHRYEKLIHIEAPDTVGRFVIDFDKGRSVAEFSFAIEIPQQFLREVVPA